MKWLQNTWVREYIVPDLTFETRGGLSLPVCGIDEAGRGPLAGPVVAGAVILHDNVANDTFLLSHVNDSKKLSSKQRDALYEHITQTCYWAVGIADVAEIDTYNILQATMIAMNRAFQGLPVRPLHALIDGNRPPALQGCTVETVIKGDSRCVSIAAASIIAKVTRDRIMHDLHRQYPNYGWERNAGYGTELHMQGISVHGITPHHRMSFAPVREAAISKKTA